MDPITRFSQMQLCLDITVMSSLEPPVTIAMSSEARTRMNDLQSRHCKVERGAFCRTPFHTKQINNHLRCLGPFARDSAATTTRSMEGPTMQPAIPISGYFRP